MRLSQTRALPRKTPSAGRMFAGYGPNKADITILGREAYPEDKNATLISG